MRVAHVVPSYLPAVRYGGPIVSVHGLCKGLVRAGHEVHVFTTNVDGPGESPVPLNVPVTMEGVNVWYFRVPALRRLYRSPDLAAALRARLSQFDVVHLHSVFLWPTWAAARAARSAGVPYVISPRGMLVRDLIRRKSRWVKTAWIALVEKRNLQRAAAIHVTSAAEAAELAQFRWRLPRIVEIPNGVDAPPEAQTPARRHDVVYIGRINWKKGLDRLIRAVARLPAATLAIAGNDEEGYTQELRRIAEAERVATRVEFLPPAYDADKWRLLRSARCFALPSYSENFGNAALEAMAAGCPVVVTPEVGAAEVVTASGGGLVTSGDPEALAAAIGALLADPAMLAEMAERGRGVRTTHSWDAIAHRTLELYRTLS